MSKIFELCKKLSENESKYGVTDPELCFELNDRLHRQITELVNKGKE